MTIKEIFSRCHEAGGFIKVRLKDKYKYAGIKSRVGTINYIKNEMIGVKFPGLNYSVYFYFEKQPGKRDTSFLEFMPLTDRYKIFFENGALIGDFDTIHILANFIYKMIFNTTEYYVVIYNSEGERRFGIDDFLKKYEKNKL